MPKTLVIVPAYNEARSLPALIKELAQVSVDVVVVNDCSTDDTETVMSAVGVRSLPLPINLGIGGAVQTGYLYALRHRYDYAVQVDGDGQHDPRYIRSMIRELGRGSNMVVGSRYMRSAGFRSTFMRRLGKRYIALLIRVITGQAISDPTSGFRACDRPAIELFARSYPVDYPEPEAILMAARKGLKVSEVSVQMRERQHGESTIRFWKSVFYMVKTTISLALYLVGKEA